VLEFDTVVCDFVLDQANLNYRNTVDCQSIINLKWPIPANPIFQHSNKPSFHCGPDHDPIGICGFRLTGRTIKNEHYEDN